MPHLLEMDVFWMHSFFPLIRRPRGCSRPARWAAGNCGLFSTGFRPDRQFRHMLCFMWINYNNPFIRLVLLLI